MGGRPPLFELNQKWVSRGKNAAKQIVDNSNIYTNRSGKGN